MEKELWTVANSKLSGHTSSTDDSDCQQAGTQAEAGNWQPQVPCSQGRPRMPTSVQTAADCVPDSQSAGPADPKETPADLVPTNMDVLQPETAVDKIDGELPGAACGASGKEAASIRDSSPPASPAGAKEVSGTANEVYFILTGDICFKINSIVS